LDVFSRKINSKKGSKMINIDEKTVIVKVNRKGEQKSKSGFYRMMALLVFIIILGVLAWLAIGVLKFVGYVLIFLWPFGTLFLIHMRRAHKKKSRFELAMQFYRIFEKKIEKDDEQIVTGLVCMYYIAVFILHLMATIFCLVFALMEKNQVVPAIYLGLPSFILMILSTIEMFCMIFISLGKKDEPIGKAKELSLILIISLSKRVIVNTFIVCLILIRFGIL
jgi:hypothetical protein